MIFIGQKSWLAPHEDDLDAPPPKRVCREPRPCMKEFSFLSQILNRAKEVNLQTCNQQVDAPIAKLPVEILALILSQVSFAERLAFTTTCKKFLHFRVSRSSDFIMDIFTVIMTKSPTSQMPLQL